MGGKNDIVLPKRNAGLCSEKNPSASGGVVIRHNPTIPRGKPRNVVPDKHQLLYKPQ
jgi:hypothetical protein